MKWWVNREDGVSDRPYSTDELQELPEFSPELRVRPEDGGEWRRVEEEPNLAHLVTSKHQQMSPTQSQETLESDQPDGPEPTSNNEDSKAVDDDGDSSDQSWFSQNWHWAVPAGCGGCLTLAVVMFAIFIGSIMYFMIQSTPYEEAMKKARHSNEILNITGEPIETGWMPRGSINWGGENGESTANFNISLSGPEGSGSLKVRAYMEDAEWQFHKLVFEGENGSKIDLLLDPKTSGDVQVKSVATGTNHTCAIDINDKLHCWGSNEGNKSTISNKMKSGIRSVSVASDHTCAVDRDGNLMCWGDDMLTLDSFTGTVSSDFRTVSTGLVFTCAVDKENNLKCWESNGQELTNVPDELKKRTEEISVGKSHACGIDSEKKLHCWGHEKNDFDSIPEKVSSEVSSVSAGWDYTCVIYGDNRNLHCWGEAIGMPAPKVKSDVDKVSVNRSVCAIDASGSLQCWGFLYSFGSISVPKSLSSKSSGVQSVSTGIEYSCAIDSNNSLWCWGKNDHGQASVPKSLAK